MSRESRKIENAMLVVVRDIVREAQLKSWQALTSSTPVDTGHARSGWIPTVTSPASDVLIPDPDKDVATAQARARNRRNAATAQTIFGSYRLEQGESFLTNPVPYLKYLNMGTSSQAPEMFVERAITKALNSIRRVRRISIN